MGLSWESALRIFGGTGEGTVRFLGSTSGASPRLSSPEDDDDDEHDDDAHGTQGTLNSSGDTIDLVPGRRVHCSLPPVRDTTFSPLLPPHNRSLPHRRTSSPLRKLRVLILPTTAHDSPLLNPLHPSDPTVLLPPSSLLPPPHLPPPRRSRLIPSPPLLPPSPLDRPPHLRRRMALHLCRSRMGRRCSGAYRK